MLSHLHNLTHFNSHRKIKQQYRHLVARTHSAIPKDLTKAAMSWETCQSFNRHHSRTVQDMSAKRASVSAEVDGRMAGTVQMHGEQLVEEDYAERVIKRWHVGIYDEIMSDRR